MTILVGCSATTPKVDVSGKLTFRDHSVAGVQVSARSIADGSFEQSVASGVSNSDGTYQLQLPEGEYYLFAEGENRFSYFGRNPVRVGNEGLTELNLSLVDSGQEATELPEPFIENGINGQVTNQGEPVAGAMIFVYTDLNSQLKGMGYAIAGPTDAEGYFEINLSSGTYYLIARSREGAATVGPLKAGDLFGYYPNNPVVTTESTVTSIAIPLLEVPAKMEQSAAALEPTIVQGTVTDIDGNPLDGMRVLAYLDPQMFNRPLKVSNPTGSDGMFQLRLPQGGTYYLAARDTLGGAAGPGDLYGAYEGNPDHSITIKTGGKLEQMTIAVEEMW